MYAYFVTTWPLPVKWALTDELPDGGEIPEPPKTDPIPEDEVPADVPEPEGD